MSHRNAINRLAAAVFVSGAALTLAGCDWTTGAAEPPKNAEFNFPERAAAVERGRYLVTIGGCNDCHTPFKMGRERPRARHEPDAVRSPRVGGRHLGAEDRERRAVRVGGRSAAPTPRSPAPGA